MPDEKRGHAANYPLLNAPNSDDSPMFGDPMGNGTCRESRSGQQSTTGTSRYSAMQRVLKIRRNVAAT